MQERKNRLYLFFTATYFAQGMVGIAYEPIFYLLKDKLRLTPSESAIFAAVMSAPFLLKPVLGLLSDAFPILRKRRVPYLLGSSLITFFCWAAMAGLNDYSYAPSLFLLTAVNVGICFADVLCDGVMVENGKERGETGRFQAAQIGTLYLTLLATGLGGGWIAQTLSYREIFAITSLFPLIIFGAALLLRDAPVPPASYAQKSVFIGLGGLLTSARFWTTSLIILLFNFSPFKGTAWFYFQTDHLGFSKILIGTLTSISGIAGVLGAAVFWKYYDRNITIGGKTLRVDTFFLVRTSVIAGIPLTLLFTAYQGTATALIITAVTGFFGVVMHLSLMDLSAKVCPKYAEATAFAVFMSVFNLSAWTSNTLGAHAYESLAGIRGANQSMIILILLATCAVAACALLLPRLKRELSAGAHA